MQAIVGKVTAFITRDAAHGLELLVFRHPRAGVQLPAGTLEEGELAERGVLREAYEETGLSELKLLRRLATVYVDLPDDQRVMLHTATVRSLPLAYAASAGFVLNRGLTVRAGSLAGEYAEVLYEERDLNADPPALQLSIAGWIPLEALAARLVRHMYQLTPQGPTPDAWDVPSDRGHIFSCYWTPLTPRPRLVSPQDEWLGRVYEALVSS